MLYLYLISFNNRQCCNALKKTRSDEQLTKEKLPGALKGRKLETKQDAKEEYSSLCDDTERDIP